MRKLSTILTLIVLFIMIGTISNADYGIPYLISYDAKIINENGITTEDGNVIPYGEIITVQYEYFDKDKSTMYAYANGYGELFKVSYNDIKLITNPEDLTLNDPEFLKEEQMYVYKEGAYLYKGPSIIYGKVDGEIMVPAGTTVTFTYVTETWGYTEYNGVKGWLYTYTSDGVAPYNMSCPLAYICNEKSTLYTIKNIKLYSDVDKKTYVGTIPKDNILTYSYIKYHPDPHGAAYYIKHNGVEGWYILEDYDATIFYSENNSIFILEDTQFYKDYENKQKGVIVPKFTECKLLCEYSEYDEYILRIEYKGEKYWLQGSQEDINVAIKMYNTDLHASKKSHKVIDVNTGLPTGEILPKDDLFTLVYHVLDNTLLVPNEPDEPNSSYYYVMHNNEGKWVKAHYLDFYIPNNDIKENTLEDLKENKIEERHSEVNKVALVMKYMTIILSTSAALGIILYNVNKKKSDN